MFHVFMFFQLLNACGRLDVTCVKEFLIQWIIVMKYCPIYMHKVFVWNEGVQNNRIQINKVSLSSHCECQWTPACSLMHTLIWGVLFGAIGALRAWIHYMNVSLKRGYDCCMGLMSHWLVCSRGWVPASESNKQEKPAHDLIRWSWGYRQGKKTFLSS